MSNITREYALELANLYGIEINQNSNEHLVEDMNGDITELRIQDVPDLFGIDFDASIKWHNINNSDFNCDNVNEHSINIKFRLEDNICEFTVEELKGVA
ncbi:hypothetical protein [Clostridium sulfidigenes]|uniref:hypothetical protein n=1 Tax=Clostridium sulfidigenes TaxID=318464 RepID=UPI003F892EFF